MIKWYRFKNFESYLEDCEVDLRVNQKVTHSYFDYELDDKTKIAKVLGVFGANGAGKSNLIKPLSFLSWFVSNSFKGIERNEKIPYHPHFLAKNENSEIEIDFCFPKDGTEIEEEQFELEFNYLLEFNKEQVVKEVLKMKTSRLYSTLFSRVLNEKNEYECKVNKKYISSSNLELYKTPKNSSVISYLERVREDQHQDDDTDDSSAYFERIVAFFFGRNDSNLNVSGRTHNVHTAYSATKVYSENLDLFAKMKKLLRKYDLGIDDIELKETTVLNQDDEEETVLMPFCIHNYGENKYRLPLHLESSGTQSAYKILASVAQRLDMGGVSILDEFDNDLHPQLTMEIVDLFKDKDTNPKNAQLIFTSHTMEALKVLRKQHVYITEKENCKSDAWRADEIEGLKERDNLYSKYISGALGGVPCFD